MKRLLGALIIVAIIVVGVVIATRHNQTNSLGKMQTGSSATTAQAVATDKVTLQNYAFSPATITVKVGTTVTWTNQDNVEHTVTADTSGGPMSQLLPRGASYTYTFSKAGFFMFRTA